MASPLSGIRQAYKSGNDESLSLGKELSEKASHIGENNAHPAPVAPPTRTSPKDLINPSKKYGDNPGEQRLDTSAITKPLGSFKRGTSRVKKTGLYKLHKNEAVLSANKAEAMRKDRVGSTLGGKRKSKGKKKHVHQMHIRHAANGGYIAKHDFKPAEPGGVGEEPEEHQIPDMAGLQQHVEDHMDQSQMPQAQGDGGQAAPEAMA